MMMPIDLVSWSGLQDGRRIGLKEVPGVWMAIQTGILEAHSEFIEQCFNPSHSFTELCDGEILIHDTKDVTSFKQFVSWLYCGKISLKRPKSNECSDTIQARQIELTNLYTFAAKLPLKALQNDIISTFQNMSSTHVDLDVLEPLDDAGLVSSNLAQYILDDIASDLYADRKLYHSSKAWSQKLRSVLDNRPTLAKTLLDANYAALERKSKSRPNAEYLEPDLRSEPKEVLATSNTLYYEMKESYISENEDDDKLSSTAYDSDASVEED